MASLLRRLVSHNINGSRLLSPRKFCSAAVNRELLEPSAPWLMMPPTFTEGEGNDMVYNLYSPIKDKLVSFSNRGGKEEADLMRDDDNILIGSSHGWLALYNYTTGDSFLSNPLSGRRIPLPPPAGTIALPSKFPWNLKMILSSSPDKDDCRAVLTFAGSAATCRPGRSDEWALLGPPPVPEPKPEPEPEEDSSAGAEGDKKVTKPKPKPKPRMYGDFVYSTAGGKFFGLRSCQHRFELGGVGGMTHVEEMDLEVWEDILKPVEPETVRLDRLPRTNARSPWWLIGGAFVVPGAEPGQLFLVELFDVGGEEEAFDVGVYSIKDGGALEPCSSLDGLAMFVGINQGMAIKASDYPELKPNSIYFSSDVKPNNTLEWKARYIGVFDYENKSCSPLCDHSFRQVHRQNHSFFRDRHPRERPHAQPWFTPTLE